MQIDESNTNATKAIARRLGLMIKAIPRVVGGSGLLASLRSLLDAPSGSMLVVGCLTGSSSF